MIAINKQEKEAIHKKYPRTPIARTVKKKSKRHRYYMAEEVMAVKYLNSLRDTDEN